MLSEDGVLSALSFSDAAPPRRPSRSPLAGRTRGSPSPTRGNPAALFSFTPTSATSPSLYTAVSAPGTYPGDYPYAPYGTSSAAAAAGSRSAGSHPYTYAWWAGDVQDEAPTACPAELRAAEAHTHAAVSEAERQRRILEMERGLAEEQRERLAARLTARPATTTSAAAAPHASPSRSPSRRAPVPQEASPAPSEGGPRPSPSLRPYAAEDAADDRLRAFSMEALPPPSSPSPPSAHVHRRHGADAETEDNRGSGGTRGASTAVVYAMPEDAVRHRPSPSPSPPRTLPSPPRRDSPSASPPRSAPRARTPPRTTPDLYSVHAPIHEDTDVLTERTSRPPSMGADRGEVESRATQRPLSAPRAATHQSAVAARDDVEEAEEEERLYAAYRRKLDRIQDALRPRFTPPLLTAPASDAAYVAYEQRRRLLTPALDPRSSTWGSTPSPPFTRGQRDVGASASERQPALPPPPPLSLHLRGRGGVGPPLTLRAPSSDVYDEAMTEAAATRPLPQRPRRPRLRWDLTRSGNITLSSDGAVCRADATDALDLIEREYGGRLDEVLRRLVIPFYAAGSVGLTRGSLTFALRWTSTSAAAGPAPALAFGVATREFAGYGAAAPAFLYLSSGVIAQGVPTGGGGGAEGRRGVERAYGAPYTPGLELAARLDLDHGELEFYVEGVSMGVAFRFQPARHPAPLFPVVVFAAELDTAELLYATFE